MVEGQKKKKNGIIKVTKTAECCYFVTSLQQ